MTARHEDPHLGLVVEGAGDQLAVPVLVRAHLQRRGEHRDLIGKAVPVHGRGNATSKGGLEGYVATAAARPGCRAVLVVLDGDGDCVAELGPDLRERGQSQSGKPVVVALADATYEDWVYASAETLGLPGITFSQGANGLSALTVALKPRKYAKPTWQPRLTARMNLDLAASRNTSLQRLFAHLDALVEHHF